MEFQTARRYYDQQVPGWGETFAEEVRAALQRLRQWPLAFPVERGDIRRMLLGRFPYKILYSVESDHLYIIALAHQHRKPDYWVGRIESR
ncbi:MAG: type II toxin-antitoxin system RelE/ParE family toxin [Gammaproteobacteria bacterium]